MSRLKFGFVDGTVDPIEAVQYGVLAEKSGFDTLWIPDHFVDFGEGERLEPWTVLGAIAARTKRIGLGCGVTDTQRSHPARTAHSVACLDVLSRGRALLGIGAGEAMNIVPYGLPWDPPRERIDRLSEAIQVIRLLWGSSEEKRVDFTGTYFQLRDAFLAQSPAQKPHPPIYVGAFASRRALKVVGRYGDGWYPWLNTPETFMKRWAVIEQEAKLAGRSSAQVDPASHVVVGLPRNSRERKAAMRSAKMSILMEQRLLRTVGTSEELHISQYQNLKYSDRSFTQLSNLAKLVPDEVVSLTMAIGGRKQIENKIEEFVRVGVRHFLIADLLAPKGVKRTLRVFRGIISSFG